jgi:soluble lytic murein transglycosylase-like protein
MKESAAHAAISGRIVRSRSSSFPAFPIAKEHRPEACRVVHRRHLLYCGIALATLIGSNTTNAAPATEMPNAVMSTRNSFADFMSEASQLFGIPASWIRAVMQVESGGDVRSVSSKGAMGLMQIMPETWASLRIRYGLGADPFDAHDNILAGAAYLRELHDRYGEPGFLAAYNAGPARYEAHLATGQPLPVETQNYVAILAPIVAGEHNDGTVAASPMSPAWREASLFISRSDSSRTAMASPSATHDRQQPTRTAVADWTALAPQSAGLFVATFRRTVRP